MHNKPDLCKMIIFVSFVVIIFVVGSLFIRYIGMEKPAIIRWWLPECQFIIIIITCTLQVETSFSIFKIIWNPWTVSWTLFRKFKTNICSQGWLLVVQHAWSTSCSQCTTANIMSTADQYTSRWLMHGGNWLAFWVDCMRMSLASMTAYKQHQDVWCSPTIISDDMCPGVTLIRASIWQSVF